VKPHTTSLRLALDSTSETPFSILRAVKLMMGWDGEDIICIKNVCSEICSKGADWKTETTGVRPRSKSSHGVVLCFFFLFFWTVITIWISRHAVYLCLAHKTGD
jgi:hypothetical protein